MPASPNQHYPPDWYCNAYDPDLVADMLQQHNSYYERAFRHELPDLGVRIDVAMVSTSASSRSGGNGVQRSVREDEVLAASPALFGVFDGVGSTTDPAIAAMVAADVMLRQYYPDLCLTDAMAAAQMEQRIIAANDAVMAYSRRIRGRPTGLPTATTVAVARIFTHDPDDPDALRVVTGHLGDSRVLRYTSGNNGAAAKLQQLTCDHVGGYVTQLCAANHMVWDYKLQDFFARVALRSELSDLGYEIFKYRHQIGRDLGSASLRMSGLGDEHSTVPIGIFPLRIGDVLMLCTDGITDPLTYDTVETILASKMSLFEKASTLVRKAQRVLLADQEDERKRRSDRLHRGKDDDMAVVLVRIAPLDTARVGKLVLRAGTKGKRELRPPGMFHY